MGNLNRVILIGRIVGEPEFRATFNGVPMVRFRLQVDRPPEMAGREAADLIDVVAWDRLAEQGKSLLTPDGIVLTEGRLQVRTFDGNDGRRRYVTEVVARSLRRMGGGVSATPSPVVSVADNGARVTGPELAAAPEADLGVSDFEAEGDLEANLPF